MQEYKQYLIGLGVKTGNQSGSRFHPYGRAKKKSTLSTRNLERVFCGGYGGTSCRRAKAKTPPINLNNNNPNNDTLVYLPPQLLRHDLSTPSKPTLDINLRTPPEGVRTLCFQFLPEGAKTPHWRGNNCVCSQQMYLSKKM